MFVYHPQGRRFRPSLVTPAYVPMQLVFANDYDEDRRIGYTFEAIRQILSGELNLSSATIKAMLVDETFMFSSTQHEVSNATSAEPDGTGYQGGFGGTGRKTITSKSFVETAGTVEMFADAVDWTGYGEQPVKAVLLIVENINDADSLIIGIYYLDEITASDPAFDFSDVPLFSVSGTSMTTEVVEQILDGSLDLSTSDIDAILVSTSFTFDPDEHFVSDAVAAAEPNGASYEGGFGGSGRKELGDKAINLFSASGNGGGRLAAAFTSWADYNEPENIKGIALAARGASDADSLVLGLLPFTVPFTAKLQTLGARFDSSPPVEARTPALTELLHERSANFYGQVFASVSAGSTVDRSVTFTGQVSSTVTGLSTCIRSASFTGEVSGEVFACRLYVDITQYNTPGDYEFTVPANTTGQILVIGWGAGGSALRVDNEGPCGGAGGGASALELIEDATNGEKFQITVSSSEESGSSVVYRGPNRSSPLIVSAVKGDPADSASGAAGGQAEFCIGTWAYSGGNGGHAGLSGGGGGGGSAFINSNGGHGTNGSAVSGTPGTGGTGLGSGGDGGWSSEPGDPGQQPGGGAGGHGSGYAIEVGVPIYGGAGRVEFRVEKLECD
jgi:hypothetical protein